MPFSRMLRAFTLAVSSTLRGRPPLRRSRHRRRDPDNRHAKGHPGAWGQGDKAPGSSYNGLMTDSADHLAAAIRDVINEAVRAALRAQPLTQPSAPSAPKTIDESPPERTRHPLTEIQRMLSISRSTVYQLIGDGRLASVKIGRRRFVTAAALSAYVDGLK